MTVYPSVIFAAGDDTRYPEPASIIALFFKAGWRNEWAGKMAEMVVCSAPRDRLRNVGQKRKDIRIPVSMGGQRCLFRCPLTGHAWKRIKGCMKSYVMLLFRYEDRQRLIVETAALPGVLAAWQVPFILLGLEKSRVTARAGIREYDVFT